MNFFPISCFSLLLAEYSFGKLRGIRIVAILRAEGDDHKSLEIGGRVQLDLGCMRWTRIEAWPEVGCGARLLWFPRAVPGTRLRRLEHRTAWRHASACLFQSRFTGSCALEVIVSSCSPQKAIQMCPKLLVASCSFDTTVNSSRI